MTPSVLLLVSILIKLVNGCQYSDPFNVRDLLNETKENQRTGFKQVFPNNYYVSHRYNKTLLCNDNPCCVLPAAYVLRDSWSELLRHLDGDHYKYGFIQELISVLKKMTEGKFQERPDLAVFPVVSSSTGDLLSFTVEVFSRWEELDCPSSLSGCVFPTEAPDQEEDEEELMDFREKEGNTDSRPLHEHEKEGARGQRRSITNVGAALCRFPGHVLWSLSFLWIALDL